MVACINDLRPSFFFFFKKKGTPLSLGLTCQPVYPTLFQANEVSYLKLKGTRHNQHCLLTYTQVHISLYTHKHACTNMYKYNKNILSLMNHLCSVLTGHLSKAVFFWFVLSDHWKCQFESNKAINQMCVYTGTIFSQENQ